MSTKDNLCKTRNELRIKVKQNSVELEFHCDWQWTDCNRHSNYLFCPQHNQLTLLASMVLKTPSSFLKPETRRTANEFLKFCSSKQIQATQTFQSLIINSQYWILVPVHFLPSFESTEVISHFSVRACFLIQIISISSYKCWHIIACQKWAKWTNNK